MLLSILPTYLLALILTIRPQPSYSVPGLDIWNVPSSKIITPDWFARNPPSIQYRELEKRDGTNYNPDGTPFLWLPEDEYSGKNFFDDFDFFIWDDPTGGMVNYINRTTAFEKNLAYVTDDNKVVMRTDNTSTLERGQHRNSVRINTKKTYTTGLFILDLDKAPYGCAIWPAFWSTGFNWPAEGEIDILEGVHDNEHNQITWHTTQGCLYDENATFTGTIPEHNGVLSTDCWNQANQGTGCDVIEWSRASYGPFFEAQGGGVLAMKWDENDISVWSFFRAAIPKDITAGTPNPSEWGLPSARLMSTMCDIPKHFARHTVVFDITLCGAWAGASYATSGCPGTCDERLIHPENFETAIWHINSLKVYRKQLLSGNVTVAPGSSYGSMKAQTAIISLVIAVAVAIMISI
ncbi:unnamed protein product [Cyclocybe aegerita]|uniref:GH16 domain-containing protein n=1 Tax=Cyclocybe aegerita TaxID=1973307 RepID=A0A8S0WRE7_CYCAE|nr:unnamed protein product [Cyclocybe aegerita]